MGVDCRDRGIARQKHPLADAKEAPLEADTPTQGRVEARQPRGTTSPANLGCGRPAPSASWLLVMPARLGKAPPNFFSIPFGLCGLAAVWLGDV